MDSAAARGGIAVVTDLDDAAASLDEIAPLYQEVYAEPPYREGPCGLADFVSRYGRECQTPGFRLALSHDERGRLSGFGYGLPLSPTTSWWQGFADITLPDGFAHEDGQRTFAIMELAVRRSWRRRGLAHALHAALLRNNPAERVTLATLPEAVAAASLYAALGYQTVGLKQPWDDAPTYRYLVRAMHTQTRNAPR